MKKVGCIFGISVMLLSSLPLNSIVYGIEDREEITVTNEKLKKQTINITQENLSDVIVLLNKLLEEDPNNQEVLEVKNTLEEIDAKGSGSTVMLDEKIVANLMSVIDSAQHDDAVNLVDVEKEMTTLKKIEDKAVVLGTSASEEEEKAEAEKAEAEKAEAEKVEAEKAEAEKVEAEKAEAEKVEAEKAEVEKAEVEKAEAEKAEVEKAEAEKAEAEKAEVEKAEAEKAEVEKAEAEKAEAEKVEAEKVEAEKAEAEKVEAEKAEAEKVEAEKAEAEKVEAEKAEVEKVEAEKTKAEKGKATDVVTKKASTTLEDFLKNELEDIKDTTDYDQAGKGMIAPRSFNYASNEQGVAAYMGTTRAKIVGELERHQYDNYYLGTPFKGLTLPSAICTSPNGDPNGYGPGFNCTGFVASAMKRSGANLNKITNVANAWGDIANAYNWRDALRQNSKYYTFNSVDQLLKSGKAQKGDIIYFEPDFSQPFYDCHIGFFWGNRSNENKFWHSYDRNIMSNIKSATPYTQLYLFKLENSDGVISDKKMNTKKFINTKTGAIYPQAYVNGLKASDNTKGLYHQEVTLTREVKNGHGTWQQFNYTKNGEKQVGWLRSKELTNFINNKKVNQIKFINKNTAVLYNRAYIPGAKNLGRTLEMKNRQVKVTESATTGYGRWYKVSYTSNGVKKTGWLNAKDLENYIENHKLNKKMMLTKNTAVLYNRAYIPGAKNLGTTVGMKNKAVTIHESAVTGYGRWYKVSYTSNGAKKTGWLKSTDLANFVEHHKMNQKVYLTKNTSVLYSRAYIPGAKTLGRTVGMKGELATVTEEATTAYGHWYKVSYDQDGEKKSGWLQAKEVADTTNQKVINRKMFITKDTAVLYDRAYVPGAKNLGKTSGMKNEIVTVREEATTGYGRWSKVSYTHDNQVYEGWLRSSELVNFIAHNKLDDTMIINKETAVLYSRAYIPGAKNLGRTAGAKGKVADVTEEATTAYGHWYKVSYEQGEQIRSGWLKSTDLDVNEK
ncbi:GW dipeptide domain-containing protein [Vagococcus intermedius]|uniref:GW dipeptide domain-containing protein n=1 Tax=Vagococcus intermedius TaxID=2991418 RepID=A0AAF0I6K7_9ENTE|nr:GW dipeptide domain-containing protein [Vagococcus intermedius]WEG73618.1 GW dipeptide domain-containing protein [Vagococcus intermedius]WEG75702.1 GW dipeptide domain-containing protein [Vagococcus intermedius]